MKQANIDAYNAFLEKADIKGDDPVRTGLARHNMVMGAIALLAPRSQQTVTAIGRMIDELVASVAIQHLEAAFRDPKSVPDVINIMRDHIEPRLK